MDRKKTTKIRMNNENLEEKSVFKYLDLYLDKKLEFEDYIEVVNTLLNKLRGIICQLRKILNIWQPKQFY